MHSFEGKKLLKDSGKATRESSTIIYILAACKKHCVLLLYGRLEDSIMLPIVINKLQKHKERPSCIAGVAQARNFASTGLAVLHTNLLGR